jgi:catechol 2,3-dioxygenase-like lactoylglutathione lyase family enzyme
VELDHVALATADARPALRTLVGELGATIISGGHSVGFRFVQARLGDADEGMTVELLEPWDAAGRDFLLRFLARHGDGPHHLTVKVDDLDAALAAVEATGRTPVGVSRADPGWMEAFLVPAEASGTVVQLAQEAPEHGDLAARVAAGRAGQPWGEPTWWPELPPRAADVRVLERVVLGTPDVDGARALFADLLGGRADPAADGAVDVVWPAGGRLRLERRDGPPGIDRLELRGAAPARTVVGVLLVGS